MHILDGKQVASRIEEQAISEIDFLKRDYGITPGLAAVLVGQRTDSEIYVRNKVRTCEKLGMHSEVCRLPEDISYEGLRAEVGRLNEDTNVHGIIVQLPLPGHLDRHGVVDMILPEKDVDGLTTSSLARLYRGDPLFEPCTPKGIIKLLDEYGMVIAGKYAVVLGRGELVGMPLSRMLIGRDATVTVCHRRTPELRDYTMGADILVVATAGTPRFVDGDMIKDGAIVIDPGIYKIPGGYVGNVDYQSVKDRASYLTPVPGGVGPMTVMMLIDNTITAAKAAGRNLFK